MSIATINVTLRVRKDGSIGSYGEHVTVAVDYSSIIRRVGNARELTAERLREVRGDAIAAARALGYETHSIVAMAPNS